MLALAILVLGQMPAADPSLPLRATGCAAMTLELDVALHLDDGGFERAREACYEQLALGNTRHEVSRAMHEYVALVAAMPAPDPGGPVAGDGWVALLPPPPVAQHEASMRVGMRPRLPSIEMHYWGSCDRRGPHGTCDQMGVAAFRMGPELWTQLRYFELYSDSDTAGAAGLGMADESDFFGISGGLWIGSWARDCTNEACRAGGAFVLPYGDLRLGPAALYMDAAVGDGPYIASGQARVELGHAFLNGSRVLAGVTAGVLGRGAAARADARLMLFGHISVDLYASGSNGNWAAGGGAGFRY